MKRPSAAIILGWAAVLAFIGVSVYAVNAWRQVKLAEIESRPEPLSLAEQAYLRRIKPE